MIEPMIKLIKARGTSDGKKLVQHYESERDKKANHHRQQTMLEQNAISFANLIVSDITYTFLYKPYTPIIEPMSTLIFQTGWNISQEAKTYGDIGDDLRRNNSYIVGRISTEPENRNLARHIAIFLNCIHLISPEFVHIDTCSSCIKIEKATIVECDKQMEILPKYIATLKEIQTLDNGMICYALDKIRACNRKANISFALAVLLGVLGILHELEIPDEKISLWLGFVLVAFWTIIDHYLQGALDFDSTGNRFIFAQKIGYIPYNVTRDINKLRFEEIF